MRWFYALANAFCLWRAANHNARAARWLARSDALVRRDRRQGELFERGDA